MRAIGIYKQTSVDQVDSFTEEQVDKPTAQVMMYLSK